MAVEAAGFYNTDTANVTVLSDVARLASGVDWGRMLSRTMITHACFVMFTQARV
jgi:hypothetical protein